MVEFGMTNSGGFYQVRNSGVVELYSVDTGMQLDYTVLYNDQELRQWLAGRGC